MALRSVQTQQCPDGLLHAGGRRHAGIAETEIEDLIRADLRLALCAVGGQLADAAFADAETEDLFWKHNQTLPFL